MGTRAAVVGIEVASKQKYLFETDKLREMVGASRLMAELPRRAEQFIKDLTGTLDVFLFQPLSGDVRLWASADEPSRSRLLQVAWQLKVWLDDKGIEHTVAHFECDARHFTATAQDPITPEERRDDKAPTRVSSLSWVNAKLSRRLSTRREQTRSDARPTNSFFAPCLIFGGDVANCWNPGEEQEARRRLTGRRAAAKLKERNSSKQQFYSDHLNKPVEDELVRMGVTLDPQRPITFSDLSDALDTPDRDDSYIAFLCADADDMGRLLPLINWNTAPSPWEFNRDFIADLDNCVKHAFHDALVAVTLAELRAKEPDEWTAHLQANKSITVPALPQLLGGDDLWTVARKDVAFSMAQTFAQSFAALTDRVNLVAGDIGATVRSTIEAVHARQPDDTRALTMSIGIAFAKCGHPAYAMAEAAEELLKSAKDRRKGQTFRGALQKPEGCIDWHIIESSLVESIGAAREDGWRYYDPPVTDAAATMFLTTRPWTISETARFIEAAARWAQDLGRRKGEQVEDILRRGSVLSDLAWRSWFQQLQHDEPADLESLAALLPIKPDAVATSPWRLIASQPDWPAGRWFETPFLDLLALTDVLPERTPAPPQKGAPDAGVGV